MKKLYLTISLVLGVLSANAQGWPENYSGVMLQGFYWDSFKETKWTTLEKQAAELGNYFSLVWLPQSGYCGDGKSMGYNPLYYWNQNSSFGTEAELRSLIKTFNANGIGTIADVVVNHRGTMTNWVDFPAEEYNGVTYQMQSTDICSDDDGGATKTWADANGYQLSSNKDGYEDWPGMRDLDHKSANVNKCIKAYVKYLVDDLGYTGFRYDMVKGFSASYVADYNNHAGVQFSVGENFGNVEEAKRWIDGAKYNGTRMSAAFDFQFHYTLAKAVKEKNWTYLNDKAYHLVSSGSEYNRYAVTFVENHDTQYRSPSETGSEAISSDIRACNAYLLAMPGTPCVFLKHWIDYKKDIKMMIEARKLAGITNTSTYTNMRQERGLSAIAVRGEGNKMLLAVVGPDAATYTPTAAFRKLCEGEGYVYYVNSSVDTSGWDAIVKRIEAESVEEPEAPFEDRDVTIYVSTKLPAGWSSGSVNYWVWSNTDGSNLCSNKKWPGDKVTQTKTVDGTEWFYRTYSVTKANHPINIVLSSGSGTPQTVDLEDIETDRYLEVSADKSGSKNIIKDVTGQHTTGITEINSEAGNTNSKVYSISGQMEGYGTQNLKPGLYIKDGKKIIVR
ncbi:MAG: alpha-amylase family glycosyl hydrolase [Bacteroidales bacterium]|nr:alpha-amylase family glycosyl hydrolase [Bacteroidales bacterium]